MANEVQAYHCPLCDSPHLTEREARRCLEGCAQKHWFSSFTAWSCYRCGKVFVYKELAVSHELSCKHIPTVIRDEGDGEETCLTCAHGDLEGHRYLPCPKNHFAPIVAACAQYQRASK